MSQILRDIEQFGFVSPEQPQQRKAIEQVATGCDRFYQNALTKFAGDESRPPQQLMLGVFEHRFQQLVTSIETHRDSLQAMQDAITSNLPKEQQKFRSDLHHQLHALTHLYLFTQGVNRLDYATANGYAIRSSELTAPFIAGEQQALRSELLKSYYLGIEAAKRNKPTPWYWRWFEKWLN